MVNKSTKKKKFVKHSDHKPKLGLLFEESHLDVMSQVSHVIQHGAEKYGHDNHKNCTDSSAYLHACLRHITSYMNGEQKDQESGLNHLAHAIANLMFIHAVDDHLNVFPKNKKGPQVS